MSYKNTPDAWKMDGLELSTDQKLNDIYDIASAAAAASLPAVSSADNGKIMLVNSGKWEKAPIPSQLPAVTSSDNGKVLGVSGGKWSGIQENYVAGDKFTNSEDVMWCAGTFTSSTSFRFLISLPKRRFSGTASVTKAKASIYYYNGTNKANDIDFIQTEGYSASVRILSDSLAMVQLIAPSAYASVTAGSNGSVYFAKDAFEVTFDS